MSDVVRRMDHIHDVACRRVRRVMMQSHRIDDFTAEVPARSNLGADAAAQARNADGLAIWRKDT